jgi:hypothetical protein
MPDFEIKIGDRKYEIKDVPDLETAQTQLKAFRQKEVYDTQAKDIEASHPLTIPFVAAHDLGRSALDNLTMGGLSRAGDYFAGDDSVSLSTEAAKKRAGWAGTALDVATAAKYIPTAVPRVVGAVGGGPGIRSLVGATTAGAEGGVIGATDAAMRDKDIGTGGIVGTLGGAVGHKVGEVIGGGVNKVAKWWKGVDDALPQYNIRDLTKNPDPMQRVNVANTRAQDKLDLAKSPEARQSAIRGEFQDVRTIPGKELNKFTPEQRRLLDNIVKGDPGTNAAMKIGDFLDNKLTAIGTTAGGTALGGPIMGAALAGGQLASGKALKSMSAAGTEEAADALRRSLYTKIPKFVGPISDEQKALIGRMFRQGGITLNNSYP